MKRDCDECGKAVYPDAILSNSGQAFCSSECRDKWNQRVVINTPAFTGESWEGISLRDDFAKAAMVEFIKKGFQSIAVREDENALRCVAFDSYALADAMMEARGYKKAAWDAEVKRGR